MKRRGATLLAGVATALAVGGLGAAQDSPPRNEEAPSEAAPPVADVPTPPPAENEAAPVDTAPPEVPAAAEPAPTPITPAPPPTPPAPLPRPRLDTAILQGMDKITAETLRFEAKVGAPVRYKGLIVTVHACETTAADEAFQDSMANVEVQTQPIALAGHSTAPSREVFKGWMFASSPTLHPLQHPTYDLWLIACRASAPVAKG